MPRNTTRTLDQPRVFLASGKSATPKCLSHAAMGAHMFVAARAGAFSAEKMSAKEARAKERQRSLRRVAAQCTL